MNLESNPDYKDNDDLGLYDSVIENLSIDHKSKSITFTLLKVMGVIDRAPNGFTYKVRRSILIFSNVIFADIPYGLYYNEWSEFYRSAKLERSKFISDYCSVRKIKTELLKHYYLGIDNGPNFKEVNIICNEHSFRIEGEEKVLHDDFDWLK